MRVVAKQNVWVNGQAYRVGEIFCVADELAVQLAFDGLVELVEFVEPVKPAGPQERGPAVAEEVEPSKKQARKRKK